MNDDKIRYHRFPGACREIMVESFARLIRITPSAIVPIHGAETTEQTFVRATRWTTYAEDDRYSKRVRWGLS